MKEVIFKKNIEYYLSIKQKDRTDLSITNQGMIIFNQKHPYFQFESSHNDEKTFVENFANPIFSVLKEYVMVVVEKKDNKVSLKIYAGLKKRNAAVPWFKTTKNCFFLSVNLETGNIYNGKILNYQNKRKFTKKIRCNYFGDSPLNDLQNNLKSFAKKFGCHNDTDFYITPILEFIKLIDGRDDIKLSPSERLFKFYLDKKKIRYPDNFPLYSPIIVATNFRKLLQRNNNRLVDAVMDLYHVKGKKLKKILHVSNSLNIANYRTAESLYGSDWLNQDDEIISILVDSPKTFSLSEHVIDNFTKLSTKKEKKNSFLVFKDYLKNLSVDGFTLSDHFRFWVELKMYGDREVIWRSDGTSESFFRQEHLDWADKLEHYKNGKYNRIYPSIYHDIITNFTYDGVEYFPILLTNSSEYNDESGVQSNCVKGYIGRAGSIIISLRKSSSDSTERLTCEFRIMKVSDEKEVLIHRIQTRGKYNSEPSELWNGPLRILDKMINDLINHTDSKTYRLIKDCVNGIRLESDTHFDEFGELKWSYSPIDNYSSFTYFNFL